MVKCIFCNYPNFVTDGSIQTIEEQIDACFRCLHYGTVCILEVHSSTPSITFQLRAITANF